MHYKRTHHSLLRQRPPTSACVPYGAIPLLPCTCSKRNRVNFNNIKQGSLSSSKGRNTILNRDGVVDYRRSAVRDTCRSRKEFGVVGSITKYGLSFKRLMNLGNGGRFVRRAIAMHWKMGSRVIKSFFSFDIFNRRCGA